MLVYGLAREGGSPKIAFITILDLFPPLSREGGWGRVWITIIYLGFHSGYVSMAYKREISLLRVEEAFRCLI